ncbi:hypothetical protein Q0V21_31210 [Paenibacillus sp. 11B]|uniref:DUF6884 domain-containing protein n=1 Tax=Paenibacillus sp. 11B TaxID=3060965 RepID=UPI0026571826|nr:DUF6884 domain-containing protein [Paenibacillus sp. 11B]MDN8593201.1 hypothetical protein [Paenibacillus sp. 11B]
MRRIALITESSARPDTAMPAHLFYQGKMSRWINTVIQYMETRSFPTEDIFFLSFYKNRIIPYQEVIEPYPKQKNHPRASDANVFAKEILAHVHSMGEDVFVEIHAGRTLADPLRQLLDENNIPYRLYADGVPLGTKPTYYEMLISDELEQRRFKEVQREKWTISSLISELSPSEASKIINTYGSSAQLYGVEPNVEELKKLLGGLRQKKKDEDKAYRDFEYAMKEEDPKGELQHFLQYQEKLSDLHKNKQFELYKNKYGKSIAKFTCYLIKKGYVRLIENKISEALFRTQIALIK